MKNSMVIIISIFMICFSMYTMLPTFAGTWRDDFEDNDTREWKIFNHIPQDEKWWINDDEAVGEIFKPGFWSLWLTGSLRWKNYSISCRAKLVDEKNEPPIVGLSLHDRGWERSRYVFYIDYLWGIAAIEKWVEGGGSASRPFVAKIDTWYELTASVYEDGTLEFKIDDTVLTAFDPDPLPGGQTGPIVRDARARFDNVEITGDNIPNGGPGKPRAVAPQTKLATTWGKLKMK